MTRTDRKTENPCPKKKTDAHPITPEEKARRSDAVRRGFANTELEGLSIPQDARELARRYIEGEITLDELIKG